MSIDEFNDDGIKFDGTVLQLESLAASSDSVAISDVLYYVFAIICAITELLLRDFLPASLFSFKYYLDILCIDLKNCLSSGSKLLLLSFLDRWSFMSADSYMIELVSEIPPVPAAS